MTEYGASRSAVKPLTFVQLRLDPLQDLEDADALINSRRKGTRPGLLPLLSERRDAMRALAAELRSL